MALPTDMRVADERAAAHGCYLDEGAAVRVRTFFERFLRHSKGPFAGKPFTLLPWQYDRVIRPLFGWKRPDGTRRFRKAYIEVPKKNGKSTLCAGIALYCLVADGEPGAEVYSAAASRDQASIVFDEAAHMVDASPALAPRCDSIRSKKLITYTAARATYRALSADVPTKDGLNISCLIFDELHTQTTRRLWDVLKYGGIARSQPLLVAITTAGFDRTSICWEQHQYAEGVLRGTIEDDAYFAFIAAADPEDDWTLEATWKKANPSYGVTIPADSFAEDCKEAQNSPLQENEFRRLRLNQWTSQDVRWIPMDKWAACKGAVELDDLLGEECFAGLDLSSTTDLSALALYFPGPKAVLPFFWIPTDGLSTRAKAGKARVEPWIASGHITATDGNVIDYEHIRKKLADLGKLYDIKEVAIDRWNSTQLQTQLLGDGFNVVLFGQGYASMNGPAKEFERLVLAGELKHLQNPVLAYMASVVSAKMDPAGNIKPDKAKSGDRIDGIVALLMALGRAMYHEQVAFDGKLTLVEV